MVHYNFNIAGQCPRGFVEKPGDISGWGQIGHYKNVKNIEKCSQHCFEKENCHSFEYSLTAKICNLNRNPNPTKGVYKDYKFCTKIPSYQCPNGYFRLIGDVPGYGTIKGNIVKDTITKCAQWCESTNGCCSFEYSYTTLKCNLNSECYPTVQNPTEKENEFFCVNDGEFCLK